MNSFVPAACFGLIWCSACGAGDAPSTVPSADQQANSQGDLLRGRVETVLSHATITPVHTLYVAPRTELVALTPVVLTTEPEMYVQASLRVREPLAMGTERIHPGETFLLGSVVYLGEEGKGNAGRLARAISIPLLNPGSAANTNYSIEIHFEYLPWNRPAFITGTHAMDALGQAFRMAR